MQNFKANAKKYVSYVGTALMVVSLVFIVRRLMADGGDDMRSLIEYLTSPWVIAGLLGVAMLEGGGIFLAGLNYRAILRNVSGVVVPRPLAIAVYTESNVYKYIPGGVMYVAGRNRLAVEVAALSHGKVALATVLEGVGMVIGVIVVTVIFALDYAIEYISDMEILPTVLLILGLLAVVIAVVLFCMRRRIGGGLKTLTSNMETINWVVIAKRIGFSIFLMFSYSATFLMTLSLLGQNIDMQLGVAIIGLYLLAWLAGFITPGAPSGLGVREVVMYMFLSDFISIDILMAAMLMHRLLTIIGDITSYFFAKILARRMNKQPQLQI